MNPRSLENLSPWPEGVSGNPQGRPKAGATCREWLNVLADKNLTRKELLAIAHDPAEPWTKQAAAIRCLRSVEAPDIKDFDPWLQGKVESMAELAETGVDTEAVKSATVIPTPNGNRRQLELYDRSGVDFDRVVEQTDGKPNQPTAIHHTGSLAAPGAPDFEKMPKDLLIAYTDWQDSLEAEAEAAHAKPADKQPDAPEPPTT